MHGRQKNNYVTAKGRHAESQIFLISTISSTCSRMEDIQENNNYDHEESILHDHWELKGHWEEEEEVSIVNVSLIYVN